MSAVNRAGLGIMLMAIMITIGEGLKVGATVGIVCSIVFLVGYVIFVCERE